MLGHTKYKGVQQAYCYLFPEKLFYGSHSMDLVMMRQQGINTSNGAFVVLPDTVCFSAAAMTAASSKSFDCALVSTLERYDGPENGYCVYYMYYISYNTFF